MRRWFVILVVATVLAGCGTPKRGCVLRAGSDRPVTNLVLGHDAADTRVALAFCERADWPAAASGYRFDDVTFYSTFSYDYQFGFDRFQGLYQGNQAVDAGTWVR